MPHVAAPPADRTLPTAGTPWLYYGWINLLMASVAMTGTLPGRTHGLGLITKPLTEDASLGVNETLFSHLNFWAILIGAALCLPVGRAIDRFGVRGVLVVVALLLGAAVAAMSRVTDWLSLLVTLTLVRGLGQGALSVVSMAMIGKWFTRRLGVAMGLYSVLLTIGFIATTLGTGQGVTALGWRSAWLAIAGCLVFGLAPLGWLIVRSSPESMGLAVESVTESEMSAGPALLDLPLRSALRSPAFWAYTLAIALFNLVWSAITLFQESLLAERGFGNETFIAVMGLLVATGLPANLLTGWLATPSRIGGLLAVGMLVLAGSLLAFPWLTTTTHVKLYGAAFGFAGGIITVIFFAAYSQAFGRTHLGMIQATVQVLMVVASATGPVLLTWSRTVTQSSSPFFYATAALAIGFGGLVLMVRLPPRSAAFESVPPS